MPKHTGRPRPYRTEYYSGRHLIRVTHSASVEGALRAAFTRLWRGYATTAVVDTLRPRTVILQARRSTIIIRR